MLYELSIQIDVARRWNSTFLMIDSILENKEVLQIIYILRSDLINTPFNE